MLLLNPLFGLLGLLPQAGVTPPAGQTPPGQTPAGAAAQVKAAAPTSPAQDEARLKFLLDERDALKQALARLSAAPTNGDGAGKTLKVNGDPLPREAIDREILYLVGAQQIQEKIVSFIIDEQIEDQVKKGVPRSKFEVLDKELDESIAKNKQQWEKENPDKGKYEDFLRAQNISPEEHRTLARNTQIFDRIFFPGHPKNWPETTAEAVMASGGEQGEAFWTRFRDSVPPIYFTSFEQTLPIVKDAILKAGMTITQESKQENSAEFRTTLPLGGPASAPTAVGPVAPANISSFTIKLDKKGADRTEVKAIPDNAQDAVKDVVLKSLATFRDTCIDAVCKTLNKPAAEAFTGEVIPFWLSIYRNWVLRKLMEWSDVRYASDGLPPTEVLRVNQRIWSTPEAVKALAQKAKPEDFERGLTEVVIRTALRQELKKAGAWLNDEQFKKEFAAYREPYDKTPFTIEVMARNFKGYPSLEAYKERWRLIKSFENMIAKEINDDNLRAHIAQCRNFLGDGRVNVQYIRVPAMDDSRGTWRENGWARARADAEKIMTEVEKSNMPFEEAIRKFGKYRPGDAEMGMVGLKSFNELRQRLGESEYLDFVNGYSVASILLNETKEGQVIGPLRCNDGFVIAKLVSRIPPGGNVSVEDPKSRDLIKQDYITTRFLKWAGDVATTMTLE